MKISPKKIAMFLDTDFPPDSRVENEALSLTEAGFEVHLFSLSYKKFDLNIEEYKGFTVHRFFASDIIYRLSALVFRVPLYRRFVQSKIQEFLERVKPDVLHVHDMVIASSVFSANDKLKLPVVLDLHENRPEIMQFYPHMKKRLNKILLPKKQWLDKQGELIKKSDYTILVTQEAIEWTQEYYALEDHHFLAVPNSIKKNVFLDYPIDSTILEKFEGSQNIIYVGDTGIRRGTLDAIESITILREKYPTIKLILVGKSTEDKLLRRRIEELGLENHVELMGWQDVSLFPSYIKVSKVAICPLHRNLHHDTTFANKVFQYMAMDIPQVVSDCDSQANLVTQYNCGLVHEASNPTDLAEKIDSLLDDTQLSSHLAKEGLKAINNELAWDFISQKLINLYKEM